MITSTYTAPTVMQMPRPNLAVQMCPVCNVAMERVRESWMSHSMWECPNTGEPGCRHGYNGWRHDPATMISAEEAYLL